MQNNIKTYGKQISLFGETESASSPEVSRASHIQQPESAEEKTTSATSGQRCLDAFGKSGRAGSWAKTFAALLVGQEGWCSRRCRLTWKLKGTKYNRLYFLLQVSALRTKDTGRGLLPTPQTQGLKVCDRDGKTRFMDLGLLQTPTTQEVVHPEMELTPTGRRKAKNGNESHSVGLADLAANGLLPTPMARDYRSDLKQETVERRALHPRGKNLKETLQQQIGESFQLNHRYCLEMMGFPRRWLDIPFQDGEKSSLPAQETP